MRAREFGKGEEARSEDHAVLYHLTDYHGYAHSISNDFLQSTGGVCTTWNPDMNGVGGRWHYDFKFVLSGKLLDSYGGDHYTDHFRYAGDDHWTPFEEDEIRLRTRKIEPLSDYLLGTIFLFDIFSEKSVQWLLYKNVETTGFLGGDKAAAPRAIDCVYKQLFELKKPIWKREIGQPLDAQEMRFIRDAYKISKSGGTFKDGLIKLCARYPIVGHNAKPMDATMAKRQFLAPKLVDMLNRYYVDRKVSDIKVPQVKRLIERMLTAIGIGNNAVAILMHEIEQAGLFHVMTPPVVWSSLFRYALEGDIDEAIKSVRYLGEREKTMRDWHDNADEDAFIRNGSHAGTMFGRSSAER